jgi:uncharacterized protein YjbI with pentapeptide repeats
MAENPGRGDTPGRGEVTKPGAGGLHALALQRRVDALFRAMASDFLLREQFVTDPAQVAAEYVHGKRLEPEEAATLNYLIYSCLESDHLIGWFRHYAIARGGRPIARDEFVRDFAVAAVANHGQRAVLALAELAMADVPRVALSDAWLGVIFSRLPVISEGTDDGTEFTDATAIETDETGTDFTGTDLTGTDLTGTDLTGTDFTGTGTGTDITGTGTDITGTDITGTGTDITGTDITGTGTDITGTDITGTDITGTLTLTGTLTGTGTLLTGTGTLITDVTDLTGTLLTHLTDITGTGTFTALTWTAITSTTGTVTTESTTPFTHTGFTRSPFTTATTLDRFTGFLNSSYVIVTLEALTQFARQLIRAGALDKGVAAFARFGG